MVDLLTIHPPPRCLLDSPRRPQQRGVARPRIRRQPLTRQCVKSRRVSTATSPNSTRIGSINWCWRTTCSSAMPPGRVSSSQSNNQPGDSTVSPSTPTTMSPTRRPADSAGEPRGHVAHEGAGAVRRPDRDGGRTIDRLQTDAEVATADAAAVGFHALDHPTKHLARHGERNALSGCRRAGGHADDPTAHIRALAHPNCRG